MASWADEFDIDDSDILGALNHRRKDPSQLASPPWAPAAAVPPPPPPLTSFSVEPHHPIISAAGLLKRFQRPSPSLNRLFLPQSAENITFDSPRKRKQGFQPVPSLPLKSARREGPNLENTVARNDSSSSFPPRESSQSENVCGPEIQSQRADDRCNGKNAVDDEQCHSLSSHGISPTGAAGETSRCHSKNSQPHNHTRCEDLEPSQRSLRDIQQNVCLSHARASIAGAPVRRQSIKRNFDVDKLQQKIACPVQTQGIDGEKRSNRSASVNVPQLGHNMEDRMHENNVEIDILECSMGMHAPTSLRKSAPDVPADTGRRIVDERMGSRDVRFLQKDLHYQIPGPAGAVQRGLGQKKSLLSEDSRMRKTKQAPGGEIAFDDADFQSGVWLKAKNYVEKSSIPVSTISSIKTSRTENRVLKLLAVIKSCIPNGCGDAMVSLKDPTDSINGTLNRRVMSETEFGRIIEPGAVVLLHQVAVFSPTPYAHYLNITINNVEQVFAKGVQFSKGECSHAASKAVLDVTEDEQMNDIEEDLQTKSKSRLVNFHHNGKSAHSEVNQLLEEEAEDELEILLAHSAHQKTHESVHNDTRWPTTSDVMQSVEGVLPCRPDCATRDQIDKRNADPVDDGYDQLLDDTDLFPCIQTRSRIA